jgi:HEPN domain-containing protein
MTPLDDIRRAIARRWLAKAADDLRAAAAIATLDDPPLDSVVFHCQQAAEKAIKAYLVHRDIHFTKTHDVARLLRLVRGEDAELADELRETPLLTKFGVEARYPGDLPAPSPAEAAAAMALARLAYDAMAAAFDR